MKGLVLLALAAAALATGIVILATPEAELGHVLGALLVGASIALAAAGLARATRRRVRTAIVGAYAGAVVAAIASRLWLGFHPMGAWDAAPWLLVLVVAGPFLAVAETPLAVAAGAVAGGCLSLLVEQRTKPPAAD